MPWRFAVRMRDFCRSGFDHLGILGEPMKPQLKQKDETYWNILDAALRLDFKKGHLRWTLTELSRATSVPRTSIYYYFGKSKEEILVSALKILGEEIFGLSPDRRLLWEQGAIDESIFRSREITEKSPHILAFYFAHRRDENAVGTTLRKLEAQHREKLRPFIKNASDEKLDALVSLLMGLVAGPRMSKKAIKIATEAARRAMS
jgi:AcrR family transcriptional regulator